jgi:hypothetical protein
MRGKIGRLLLGNEAVNTLPLRQRRHTRVDRDHMTFPVGPRRRFIGDNKGRLQSVVAEKP